MTKSGNEVAGRGAGDALVAALTTALDRGQPPREAARWAVAGLPGDSPVTRAPSSRQVQHARCATATCTRRRVWPV